MNFKFEISKYLLSGRECAAALPHLPVTRVQRGARKTIWFLHINRVFGDFSNRRQQPQNSLAPPPPTE